MLPLPFIKLRLMLVFMIFRKLNISLDMDRKVFLPLVLCACVLSDCVSCYAVKGGLSRRMKREISCDSVQPDKIARRIDDKLKDLNNFGYMILNIKIDINTTERIHTSTVIGINSLTNVTAMETTCNEGIIKFNTTLGMNQSHISYNLTRNLGQDREFNDQIWMNATKFEWNVLVFVNTRNDMSYTVSNSIFKQPKDFIIGSNSEGVFNPTMAQMSYMTVKFHFEKILNAAIDFELLPKIDRIRRNGI